MPYTFVSDEEVAGGIPVSHNLYSMRPGLVQMYLSLRTSTTDADVLVVAFLVDVTIMNAAVLVVEVWAGVWRLCPGRQVNESQVDLLAWLRFQDKWSPTRLAVGLVVRLPGQVTWVGVNRHRL